MSEERFSYRRKTRRVSCNLNGICFTKESFCNKIECSDISEHGARILAPQPLAIGSYVDVALSTRKVSNVSAQAKVCWCAKTTNGWQAGLAFNRELPYSAEMLA